MQAGNLDDTRIWPVNQLCQAISNTLGTRFAGVTVQGEISNLSRSGSGHIYFSLKDESAQLRCAMFRRNVQSLTFALNNGDHVVLRGRVSVYEPRGDLQLVVESMRRSGTGGLLEQFLYLKARLESEGLFAQERKRPPLSLPRGVAVVTSLQAAALHDVITAMRRRAAHVPVVVIHAAVQGAAASASLCEAMEQAFALALGEQTVHNEDGECLVIDTILLVRGGGSMEDLAAFNNEVLARLIAASPVPVIVGVGHESDFSIADFVADLRAPTPTAAAELAARPRQEMLAVLDRMQERLGQSMDRALLGRVQMLDRLSREAKRPSLQLARYEARLDRAERSLQSGVRRRLETLQQAFGQHSHEALRFALNGCLDRLSLALSSLEQRLGHGVSAGLTGSQRVLERLSLRLEMLDPQRVLDRGYAIVTMADGHPVCDAAALRPGMALDVRLAKGSAEVEVVRSKEG